MVLKGGQNVRTTDEGSGEKVRGGVDRPLQQFRVTSFAKK
jgi:hypothetical protein